MGIFSGWLLASDVDGTLMNNGVIDERSKEKISRFIDEGGIFSLSTGRTPGAVNTVLRQLDKISPSVMGNGTIIYDFKERRLLYNLLLPNEDKFVVKLIKENFPYLGIEVHCGVTVYALQKSAESDLHQFYEEMSVTDGNLDEIFSQNWTKVLIALTCKQDHEKIKELIKDIPLHSSLINTAARIDGKDYDYLELVPLGTSKASALKELCKMMGIQKGRFCAIGDYYNDVEMLKAADISACPIESPDDIKAHADLICSKAEDGAVADFIDYIENIIRKETENGR